MRLLLDQGLPRSTVRHLANMGVVAEHVGDLGLARAADTQILDFRLVGELCVHHWSPGLGINCSVKRDLWR
jgi:predicted nuclease of predicted toxin-antitoxin system